MVTNSPGRDLCPGERLLIGLPNKIDGLEGYQREGNELYALFGHLFQLKVQDSLGSMERYRKH